MKHLFIGIDIGTSSAKLVLADETGTVLHKASAEYKAAQPKEGWSEIEPGIWYDAVSACMKKLLSGADRGSVEGIGVTGQMHTTVFMDVDGNSIRPALMWTDKRTKKNIAYLKEQISLYPQINYIANIISTGSPAANLFWLKENEPENLAKLHKFLIGPDYIVFRLTGVYGTDYCESSTSSLYDLQNKRWSEDMRQIIGLTRDTYPEVRGSARIAGSLQPEIAHEFGLKEDVKVIVGTGDNPAAAITTGCLGHNNPVISLGTSGVLMLSREKPDFDAKGKNILFSFNDKDFFYLVQGVVQATGSSYAWWIRDILNTDELSAVDAQIDINTACRSEVIFYPHLSGDKTLYADPNLRGAFIGLSADTTRWEMAFAVMEGISFAFKELAQKMHFPWNKHSSINVVGGGAQSEVWMQTMSDILNIQINQLEGTTSASFAMALLAAYGCGRITDLGEASDKVMTIRRSFIPRPEFKSFYAQKYERYLRIHDAMLKIRGEG